MGIAAHYKTFLALVKQIAMSLKYLITVLLTVTLLNSSSAQNKKANSPQVVSTLKTILSACKNVDFADSKVKDSGMYYKAATYIIYRAMIKNESEQILQIIKMLRKNYVLTRCA